MEKIKIEKEIILNDEFFIEELEARIEFKAADWVRVEPCRDPSHCHPY
jgi:hypothetical protein